MKKIIVILLLLLGLYSCNKKPSNVLVETNRWVVIKEGDMVIAVPNFKNSEDSKPIVLTMDEFKSGVINFTKE